MCVIHSHRFHPSPPASLVDAVSDLSGRTPRLSARPVVGEEEGLALWQSVFTRSDENLLKH